MNDTIMADETLRELAQTSRSWPFVEARAVLERFRDGPPAKGYVLFETGYGPSGLPHIGTFGEVVRTTMVRRAFALLSDIPTRLFAFSDDMDALRKVPDNVPNQEMLRGVPGPAADVDPRSRSVLRRASATTTTPACAPSSTASASSTNS